MKSLSLTNFGPLEGERTFNFIESGVIGIVGKNGRGKSHLQAALTFVNFGDTNRTVGELTKPGCYYVHGLGREGMPRKAEVVAEYRTASGPLVIERKISISDVKEGELLEKAISDGVAFAKSSSRGAMSWNGTKETAAEATVRKFAELTKLNSKAAKQAVFVRQGTFGHVVHEADPADRIDAIHELSGADQAQRIVELARSRRQFLQVTDRSEEIAIRTANLQQYVQEVKNLQTTLDASKPGEPIEELQRRYDEVNNRILAYTAADQRVQTAHKRGQQICEQLIELESKRTALQQPDLAGLLPPGSLSELETYIRTSDDNQTRLRMQEQLQAELYAAQQALAELQQQAVPAAGPLPESEWPAVQEQIDRLSAIYAESKKFLDVFQSTGRCSTCGSVPEGIEDKLAQHRQVCQDTTLLDHLRKSLADSRTQLANHQRAVQTLEANRRAAGERLNRADAALKAFGPAVPAVDQALYNEAIIQVRKHKEIEQANKAYLDTVKNLDWQKAQLHEETTKAKAEEESALAELQALGVAPSKDEHQLLSSRINSSAEASRAHAELSGRLTGMQTSLRTMLEELQRMQAEQKDNERIIKQARFLDGVIAAMHRDQIPSDLSAEYVARLNVVMRETSIKLSAPFILRMTDTFTFVADSETGPVPMFQLSGGQKTMASWIYHLSLHALHGEDIGLLFLDEPTEGLDAENLSGVADVLERVSQFCVESAQQVCIITHEQDVLGRGFNQVITVE